ncbi:unnamed protein product [Vicia faba]|uniref:F-box domain-containing protein n=1 Tax=Vicia faba TaxID=3906 RepID=A0AAV1AKA2_VICFA|nr:unnamed protein product [Vicia faba]
MFLPHELIIQILLRLPVKSLIHFKCVCKLWFSLISHDTHFASLHFQLNSTTHTSRILFLSNSTHEALSIDFEASLHDDTASVSLNLPEDFRGFEIRGSCRGFILFCSSLNIYLWNPSTGIHKQIPLSPFASNLDAEYFYGFGYDDSTDDYFVVSMSRHDSEEPPLHLEYFSLKSNTWKEVEGPHFPYNFQEDDPKCGLLYKGAIHWLGFRYDLQTDVILAFDLIERKLSYMLLPTDSDGSPLEWDGEDGLVKYDTSGQCLEQHSYPNYDLSGLTMYIDSLLSLPSDGHNQQA